MDVQAAKIELAKWILDINDPSLIMKVKDLLTDELNKEHHTLTEQEQREIKLGLAQLDRGERISFDDFMNKVS